jgi:glycine cleavage system H protein
MQRPARPRPTEFPEDRRYHAGHTWARFAGADGRGPLRVGLDAFAAWLVADASAAILPQPGTAVACGGPGLWVVDGVAPVAFAMPASGVASRANPLLRTAPRLVVEEPYDAGWLLEVECAAPAAALVALQPAPAMAARAESLAREFAASALAQARRARECVGAALPDGGEPAADWRSVLGPRAYHALVQRFLAERSAGRRAATPP